jgi:dipeptidyl aminopeptidase/acylaminoacyl peptidase
LRAALTGTTPLATHIVTSQRSWASLAVLLSLVWSLADAGRPISPEDWFRFETVSDLQMAHDGSAVAYLVTRSERSTDDNSAQLWQVPWQGGTPQQLTHGESVSSPRFSPDGRYLSFLSARPAAADAQIWTVSRRDGTLRQISHVHGDIIDYAWSPDSKRIVLSMRSGEDDARPKPLVITALHFKDNEVGYLSAAAHAHLYLLDVAAGTLQPLTSDPSRSDALPLFSPDGNHIAFVSHRFDTEEQLGVDEICLVAAQANAQPKLLVSTWAPNYQKLAFSPDGKLLAFLKGDELKYNAYILDQLGVVEVTSGAVRMLTAQLDRAVESPAFTADGQAIQVTVEDDGYQYPAQVPLNGAALQRLSGPMVAEALVTDSGRTAVLASDDRSPVEVYALEHGELRALSAHNRALLKELALGSVEDLAFRSRDGTEIHGQLLKPPDFVSGRRYPLIVWLHGGPVGQDDHSLEFDAASTQLERQLFASHGYLVLAVNYRGGSGRGLAFARSIAGDWGHLEVEDILAGVDYVLHSGIADPERLGVGGWSYGGLLTDYCIASDTRFKAAISGAGSGNQLGTYGTDDSIEQYNAELGPPWRSTADWLKVSYPFFHADRIRTPTLFLGGTLDMRVPIAGSEQMYEALRTLGVPSQLIVYPGEWHTLERPSFLVDHFQRYLDWMGQYLGH